MAYDEALASRVRTALSTRHDVIEKKMFGGIAFLVRGRMGIGIVGPTLMLRLADDEFEGALDEPHARPMDFTGRPMKGFLYVDPPGTATDAGLQRWLDRATAYAESQPVKLKAAKAAPAKRSARKKTARASSRQGASTRSTGSKKKPVRPARAARSSSKSRRVK